MTSEYSIRVVAPPAVEPVTVEDVKLHTHIGHDVEDALIATWITAARETAEDYQRRSYYTQTLEISFDAFPELPILLPRPPAIEVLSISYFTTDNTEVSCDLSDFVVDVNHEPGRIAHDYGVSWPSTTLRDIDAVRIRYVAGYGDAGTTTGDPDAVVEAIPATVKNAIYLYCAWQNENRLGETEFPRQFYDLLRRGRMPV